MVALHSLKTGGSFVVKVFSLLETQSLCLVHLLYRSFDHLSVFKPTSSKAGSGELYLICRGFRRDSPDAAALLALQQSKPHFFQHLSETLGNFALLPRQQIPLSFLLQYESAVTLFSHWQREAIETNLKLYQSDVVNGNLKRELTSAKRRRARLFLKKFAVRPMLSKHRLTGQETQ